MVNKISEEKWVEIFDQLSCQKYIIIDDFLTPDETHQLREQIRADFAAGLFKEAGIGTSGQHQVNQRIRKDHIRWLDPDAPRPSVVPLLEEFDRLLALLNRYCYLNLSGYEFHYALYQEGSFYRRHLDQFKGRNNRLLSVVLYLNKDWTPDQGGVLRLFLSEKTVDVEPLGGRLVLFKSDELEHEVLETFASRYSITGWLLHRPPGLGILG